MQHEQSSEQSLSRQCIQKVGVSCLLMVLPYCELLSFSHLHLWSRARLIRYIGEKYLYELHDLGPHLQWQKGSLENQFFQFHILWHGLNRHSDRVSDPMSLPWFVCFHMMLLDWSRTMFEFWIRLPKHFFLSNNDKVHFRICNPTFFRCSQGNSRVNRNFSLVNQIDLQGFYTASFCFHVWK